MREFAPGAVGSSVRMTHEERLEHIAYYRERIQELQQVGRWLGPSAAEARATIAPRLIALERTVALLQDSAV